MRGYSCVALFLCGLYVVCLGAQDPTITIPIVLHDYFPCDEKQWASTVPNNLKDKRIKANCNPDVEPQATSRYGWGWGLTEALKGMVSNRLNNNRKMVYIMPTVTDTDPKRQTKSARDFNRWWDSNWDGNWPMTYNLVLKLNDKTGLYTISNAEFFPLDNKGWGNNGDRGQASKHNYGFCMEAHAAFIYNSTATLSFEGDDDMWIFLNNQLVFDIGGIHSAVRQTTVLKDVRWSAPMIDGYSYPFDMFYCERQTLQSDIILTTTMNIYCPNNQFDKCGVCQGKGDCCAKCESNNKCEIATLDPKTCDCNRDTTTIPKRCQDEFGDQCNIGICDNNDGCKSEARPSPFINGCQKGSCNPNTGWSITPNNPCVSKDMKCYPTTCTVKESDKSAVCHQAADNQCAGACMNHPCEERPCYDVQCRLKPGNDASEKGRDCIYTSTLPIDNACFRHECSPADDNKNNYTIISILECKNSSNLCSNSTCDVLYGGCTPTVYTNCDDKNACTIDMCVESTGNCTHTNVDLSFGNNTCIVSSCDQQYGVTVSNITCKGVDCRQDPTVAGCCICKGVPIGGIIGAGAIAGIVVAGLFAAAVFAFGAKSSFNFFAANAAAAGAAQTNPLYVPLESGGNNPLYQGAA